MIRALGLTIMMLYAALAAWGCAKPKFKESPAHKHPDSDVAVDTGDGTDGGAGGDHEGIGFDPDPNSTLPPHAYPPGSKKPSLSVFTDEDLPKSPNSPGDPFVPCATGANKDQFPIFAKAYEFGKQEVFPGDVKSDVVLGSVYYGFNTELNKPDYVMAMPGSLKPYTLVADAVVDWKLFATKKQPSMSFLFDKFKADKIEENDGQTHLDKFNYRTRFCMQNFDVSNRSWSGGLPQTNENNAGQLKEWFSIRAAAYFFVPEDGNYEFMLRSDDGSIFQILEKAGNGIGEVFALSNDGVHSVGEAATAPITLEKSGIYIAHMRHFQGPRDYIGLQLFWKKPGASDWEIVPTSAFRYDDKLLDPGGHRPY